MSMLAHIVEPTAPAFQYGDLPSDIAYRQRERAHRIIGIQRRTVEAFVEIGNVLLEAQAELEKGTFVRWIEQETGLSKTTAYRAMAAAEHVAPRIPNLGNLKLTVVQKIADAPADAREEIVSALERGETLPATRIEGMISSARMAAKEAKLTEGETKRRARARESAKRHARAMANRIFTEAAEDLEKAQREHEAAVELLALFGDKRPEALNLLKRAGYDYGRDLASKATEPRLTPAVAAKIKGTRLDVDIYRQAVAFLERDRQQWRVDADLSTIERADRVG